VRPRAAIRRPRPLRTLASLPAAERRATLAAWAALPLAALGLRLLGFRGLVRFLDRLGQPAGEAGAARRPGRAAADPRMLTRAVERAAGRALGHYSCLPRSLVLWTLLRRGGLPAQIWVGVRRDRDQLEAHAWVELDGAVLNDAPDIRERFSAFEQPLAASLGP
jgi:hypothetical protein